MSLLRIYLENNLLKLKHYKITLISFFLTPIFVVLKWYLTGEFVKEIIFYNKDIKYLYFLVFSMIISQIFRQGWKLIITRFYNSNSVYECLLKGFHKVLFYRLISYLFEIFLSNLFVILIVLFVFSINFERFLISIILSFSLIIFSVSLALLISPLFLYFKGEEINIIQRYLYLFSEILTPIMFSFYLFPNYKIIARVLPSIGLVEEIRKYLFLGTIDIKLFIECLVISIVYFIIGVFIFAKVLNYARFKGWIGLR